MKTLSLLPAAVCFLAAVNLVAENAVMLEDFEENIDSASQGDWGGSRVPDYVALSQYTKTNAQDPNVTHGNKSLKIDLSGSEGWVLDYKITFSDAASKLIHDAFRSTDVARYVLRYDLIFPGGTTWMNSQIFIADINDEVDTPDSANGGKLTMSLALDLIKGVPDDDSPIVLRFSDDFDAVQDPFVGPLTLYLDNLRLVDTYAPGVTPVTTVIQGFENATNSTGGAADFTGWGGTPRTTYKQYTKQSADDIRVTEGTHALQVDYAGAGTWNADFTLPFAGTKLADILRMDLPAGQRPSKASLERYTLRFDITYPDRDDNGLPSWEVTSFNTLAAGFPFSEARRDAATGQQQTISLGLDQIEWSDTAAGAPVLMFVANGDWAATGSSLYFDNFRLIDTGATPAAAEIKIASVQFEAKTSAITLQWNSEAGKTYAIDYTQNLGSWPTVLAPSVQGAAGATSYSGTVPAGHHGFLRVRPTN